MNKIQSLPMASALALLVAATAPFQAGAQDTPPSGGTLVMAIQDTPRHLNPAVQSGIFTGEPGTQLFASPLRYDEGWNPQPYLAQSWSISDDELAVTLNLVKGAQFHDGQPITSADVAFSVETVQAHHPFKNMFEPVERVETPDAHTAILRLSRPHPAVLLAMSSQLLPIIPKHIYDDGQDLKTHPRNSEDVVGSGPFKLVEFKRDQHITLERFDDFFIPGRPYLDRIIMRIMKDDTARTIALESGEVMLSAFEEVPRNLARLRKNPDLNVSGEGYSAIGSIIWLAFNTGGDGPTADLRVRQAIAYALDRDFLLNALLLGSAPAAKTGIHPGSPFYDAGVNGYELDLDKANRLLDEAGYPRGANGIRFPLSVDFGWSSVRAPAEYLKPQLKKIGIDVAVRASADFGTWSKRVSNFEFDMTMDNVFNWGDPIIGVHRTYDSQNIKKGVIWSNTQQYANPRVDELMKLAGTTFDIALRKRYYAEFQQIIAEELPIYFLYAAPLHTVTSTRVGNPPRSIWGTCSPLDRVWLKES